MSLDVVDTISGLLTGLIGFGLLATVAFTSTYWIIRRIHPSWMGKLLGHTSWFLPLLTAVRAWFAYTGVYDPDYGVTQDEMVWFALSAGFAIVWSPFAFLGARIAQTAEREDELFRTE